MSDGGIAEIYDLTPLQAGMLFHCVSSPESTVYNIQLDFTLEGPLNVEDLVECWGAVAERHAPLRTSFVWERIEKPYQVVHRAAPMPVSRHDWRQRPAGEKARRLESLVNADRNMPFDLRKAPLMRLAVVALADREYRMIWTFHHVLLEGWSAAIVLTELWTLYGRPPAARRDSLPAPRPYVDYIRWLQAQDPAAAESYWRQRLVGYRSVPRLPIDRIPEGAALPTDLHRCQRVMGSDECVALRRLARDRRLTANTIVQGMWAILLSRYTGEADVVFGTALSGRPANLADAESIVGLFVNVLPIRASISAEERVVPWLQTFQLEQATLRDYEYSSLMQVKAWSELPAREPLFETAVAFENWLGDIPAGAIGGGLEVRAAEVHDKSDQPLSLFATIGAVLSLTLMYDTTRFERAAIERMLDHLVALLESFIADPQRRISELEMLTPPEREQLLDHWRRTPDVGLEPRCVHEIVAAHAERSPDAIAVAAANAQLTYAELNRHANRLAHHLAALGLGPEVIATVVLDRSPEMVVALLAILKTGGAYVPLDPGLPAERILHVLDDTRAPMLLTRAALADELSAYAGETICLESVDSIPGAGPDANPAVEIGPANRAYVIYTSGSTGAPKGVEICHRGLSNLVSWHCQTYELAPQDRTSHVAGLGFDASVWELWPTLCAAASLHLVPDAVRQAPRELWTWLALQRITVTFMPTPLAEAALREPLPADLSLRFLLTGGDRLHGGLVDRALPFKLVNHYGPTENSVVATCCEVDPLAPEPPTIGRPIANVHAYVLDEWLNPVPAGFPGELCLGGLGVARGYLNQPELTAARFVSDRFSEETGARLYRTGDLVAFGADGNIEFLGRTDDQIKIRGFRIEPGEIESALAAHTDVSSAVVMSHENGAAGPRLVAYVVAAPGCEPPAGNMLTAYLATRLPDFMLPATYIALPELPVTDNGKVDRDALAPPPRVTDAATSTASEAPTEHEKIMIDIWQSLLEIDDVHPEDMFLDLGGHSLLAIKVIETFEQKTGIRIKPTDLVRYSLRQLFYDIDREDERRTARGGRGFLDGIRAAFRRNAEQVND